MSAKKKRGVCKLTGQPGIFVKSHLIPKALTRPAVAGAPFIETSAYGARPKRSWSSWYDLELVTAEGEAILAEFDNWAVPELRRQKLIWSGWGPLQSLPYGKGHDAIAKTGWGLRRLEGGDFGRLRLFFLSLLWRAVATKINGFADIELSAGELAELGARLVARDPGPPSYFGVQLIQISTLGEVQNLTPIARTKRIPAFEDITEHSVPFFRFYFNGLIAHIHPNTGEYDARKIGPLVLGQDGFTAVATVKYEMSFQRENMLNLVSEAWRGWPQLMEKL
ncbi:hypothetical protein [Bradyrhizobium sp. SZCCHNR1004]|uniref:hypothetical protein n=1 Tax=Bradyrhizobium sp. SZCCHNR1004 TaxID=3057335 RepID=UPI0029169525|nr:hypothetical protein [Bradyrhizobium sp. SZCCHNR1004]